MLARASATWMLEIGGAMRQCLEAPDRLAELLAGLEVAERHREGALHHAEEISRGGERRLLDRLDEIARDRLRRRIVEHERAVMPAVLGPLDGERNPGRIARDQRQAAVGRDEKRVGAGRHRHEHLAPGQAAVAQRGVAVERQRVRAFLPGRDDDGVAGDEASKLGATGSIGRRARAPRPSTRSAAPAAALPRIPRPAPRIRACRGPSRRLPRRRATRSSRARTSLATPRGRNRARNSAAPARA